jgi:hypothetical protein
MGTTTCFHSIAVSVMDPGQGNLILPGGELGNDTDVSPKPCRLERVIVDCTSDQQVAISVYEFQPGVDGDVVRTFDAEETAIEVHGGVATAVDAGATLPTDLTVATLLADTPANIQSGADAVRGPVTIELGLDCPYGPVLWLENRGAGALVDVPIMVTVVYDPTSRR